MYVGFSGPIHEKLCFRLPKSHTNCSRSVSPRLTPPVRRSVRPSAAESVRSVLPFVPPFHSAAPARRTPGERGGRPSVLPVVVRWLTGRAGGSDGGEASGRAAGRPGSSSTRNQRRRRRRFLAA